MNLYIGNLSYNVSEDMLTEVFAEFGTVLSAKIITDKFTGKSKGFGFVEIEGKSDSHNVIETLNGKEIDGRAIIVNKARPKE